MNETAEIVIARWRAAYEAANGTPAPIVAVHGNGWYRLTERTRLVRVKQIEAFAERLELRAMMIKEGQST